MVTLGNGSGTDFGASSKHHNVFQWNGATPADAAAVADARCVQSLRDVHWRNNHLCMPPGLCSTLFSTYFTTEVAYRNRSNVYICMWWGSGILCKPECYTGTETHFQIYIHMMLVQKTNLRFVICNLIGTPWYSLNLLNCHRLHCHQDTGNKHNR